MWECKIDSASAIRSALVRLGGEFEKVVSQVYQRTKYKDFTKGPFIKDVRLTPGRGDLRNPDVQLLFKCGSIVLSRHRGEGGLKILVLARRPLRMALERLVSSSSMHDESTVQSLTKSFQTFLSTSGGFPITEIRIKKMEF